MAYYAVVIPPDKVPDNKNYIQLTEVVSVSTDDNWQPVKDIFENVEKEVIDVDPYKKDHPPLQKGALALRIIDRGLRAKGGTIRVKYRLLEE